MQGRQQARPDDCEQELSPLSCLDDNRAKQSKAIIALAILSAVSIVSYGVRTLHWDGLSAPGSVEAHYAPIEDPTQHTELR